jgi:hypothetical protein
VAKILTRILKHSKKIWGYKTRQKQGGNFMFTEKGYSLSDVAAVTRNGEDGFFGGNGAWWILLFFMFAGWGGGFGGSPRH